MECELVTSETKLIPLMFIVPGRRLCREYEQFRFSPVVVPP